MGRPSYKLCMSASCASPFAVDCRLTMVRAPPSVTSAFAAAGGHPVAGIPHGSRAYRLEISIKHNRNVLQYMYVCVRPSTSQRAQRQTTPQFDNTHRTVAGPRARSLGGPAVATSLGGVVIVFTRPHNRSIIIRSPVAGPVHLHSGQTRSS